MLIRSCYKRFVSNFADPAFRVRAFALIGGKFIGLALLLSVMYAWIGSPLQAQAAPATPPGPTPEMIAINTAWTLIAAFLVFCMQVGFVMLEAGFARSRESVNILVEGIVDTCICGVTFWAWGFAFMFMDGNGLIGLHGWFLKGLPEMYGTTGVPLLAFWVFQYAFADTCSTITSGAMIGRCGFVGDILYSIGVTGFIYPIIGHWAWGPDGWLAVMNPIPFHDFAGSTVVHSIGGAISLTGAIALGPRLGRVFKRDGGGPMLPHNIILGAVGGLILWFGWYGFNPGSTLSAMDTVGIGRVSFNTTLAACSAGLTALFYMYARTGTWDLSYTTNGFLAGLVAITCPCYWVTPTGAFFVGVGGAIVCVWAIDALEYLRIDDPIGAVPVHWVAGMWGTFSLGLFASGQFGSPTPTGADVSSVVKGLLYGGGMGQLKAQVIGILAVNTATLIVSFALMYAVKATGTLRIHREGELEGLDLHEHGTVAYPEYVLHHIDGTPGG
ncbi:MAG TPA: ammonium transporter [Vicinamibacterales bacterium]|jgi:Amt family ammonium transporter|nr:ammonium transporter [Vicinamibacterales bacterium]